jgi:hypothetical protein
MQALKTFAFFFQPPPDEQQLEEFDRRVHDFLGSEEVDRLVDLKPSLGAVDISGVSWMQLVYTLLYEAPEEEKREKELQTPDERLPEKPLLQGAVSPTLAAIAVLGKERTRVQAMAGVFPVPEGERLSPEDTEPAPPVALSPDWKWEYGAELFGNTGKEV